MISSNGFGHRASASDDSASGINVCSTNTIQMAMARMPSSSGMWLGRRLEGSIPALGTALLRDNGIIGAYYERQRETASFGILSRLVDPGAMSFWPEAPVVTPSQRFLRLSFVADASGQGIASGPWYGSSIRSPGAK